MINASAFIRKPLLYKKDCYVFPPSVAEVAADPLFTQYLKILTITQEDINDLFEDKIKEGQKVPSPFIFMFSNYIANEQVREVTEKAFEFFLHKKVTFFAKAGIVIIGNIDEVATEIQTIEDLVYLNDENFLEFQNLIRESIGEDAVTPPVDNPNEDPRVRALKAKFRKNRKEVARIKAKTGQSLSFESSLVAICCMQIGLNPLNIGEISYASLGPLIQMYQRKEKYDIDIRSILAGADAKKIKPEYWIGNLSKK